MHSPWLWFKPLLFFIFLVECFFLSFLASVFVTFQVEVASLCVVSFVSHFQIGESAWILQKEKYTQPSMYNLFTFLQVVLQVTLDRKSPFNPPTPQSVEFSWKFLIQHSWRMFYPYKMCAAMFMPLKGCFWNHPRVVPAKKCVAPKELCIKTSKIIVPVIFLLKIFTDIFSYKLCYI